MSQQQGCQVWEPIKYQSVNHISYLQQGNPPPWAVSAQGTLFRVISRSYPGGKLRFNLSRKETDVYRQVFSNITGSRTPHENGTIKKVCLQTQCQRKNSRGQKVTKHLQESPTDVVKGNNKCRDTTNQIVSLRPTCMQ